MESSITKRKERSGYPFYIAMEHIYKLPMYRNCKWCDVTGMCVSVSVIGFSDTGQ